MAEQIMENLWSFPVVLPENPLKWLNCYVIKGGASERNLLIDSGFHRQECIDSLLGGMEELGIDPKMTDVVLTHVHSDHTGNAALLQEMGCRLLMHPIDYDIYLRTHKDRLRNRARAVKEGMDGGMFDDVMVHSPAMIYRSAHFTPEFIEHRDELVYGDYHLRCISTPGHTPGHICLYEPEKQIMFLGDHVLFDITPNICAWSIMDDALGTYLDSLQMIDCYPVKVALPAHRNTSALTMHERIAELMEHHEKRLRETERIVGELGPVSAYELAGKMTWRIRAKSWEEFPLAQKWFAFSETLAHLDYLERRHRVVKITDLSGNITYVR